MDSYGRNILILSILFLVNSLAIDMINPIWPIFVNFLGASMTELGLVFAVSNAVGAVMQIPSGLLSDKYGRKRLHVIGTLLTIVPPLMYAVSSSWADLVPWIALSGFAIGLYLPIRWAIIADVSSSRGMASAYSWTNIAWLTGATVAPFIGGLVADTFGIRYPFITCFILSFAILPLALILGETRKRPAHARESVDASKVTGETGAVGEYRSTVFWISLINVIQGVGIGVTRPIIPVFVVANFSVDFTFMGFLYAIGFGVASIIAQIPGARLSNRFDRRKMMFATFAASAPFFLIFAYSQNVFELVLFMFLSNVILNLHWPAYQTYLMDATPSSKWGLINGVSATTFWVGLTVGSAISGVLWDVWGSLMPFYVSCLAIAFSALPVIPLKPIKAQRE